MEKMYIVERNDQDVEDGMLYRERIFGVFDNLPDAKRAVISAKVLEKDDCDFWISARYVNVENYEDIETIVFEKDQETGIYVFRKI